jgi:hypothetical protein
VGTRLANDPQFAEQAWRAYGIVYAWPLFFYTFFYDPHQIWVVWGIVLAFGIIPVAAASATAPGSAAAAAWQKLWATAGGIWLPKEKRACAGKP